MRFLIIGCGAMGKLRARDLRQMGYNDIAAYDVRDERCAEIERESGVQTFMRFKDALREGADLALVCTPPDQHEDCILRSIDARMPVFCETPLTLSLESADKVIEAAAAAGYPLLASSADLHGSTNRIVKELLEQGEFGRPLSAIAYTGQHIADACGGDCAGNYRSSRAQGGMGFDVLPRELQLFSHFFGDPRSLICMARRRSQIPGADDTANDVYDVMLDMSAGVSVAIHVDVFQRPSGEFRRIVCEHGVIDWSQQRLRVAHCKSSTSAADEQWEERTPAGATPGQMYADELAHIIRGLNGEEPVLLTPRRQRQILAWALACEESSAHGAAIAFK